MGPSAVCAFTRFDHPEMIFPSFACSIRRDARLSADLVHSIPLGLSSALVPPERVIIWKLPQVSTAHSPALIALISLISLIALIAPTYQKPRFRHFQECESPEGVQVEIAIRTTEAFNANRPKPKKRANQTEASDQSLAPTTEARLLVLLGLFSLRSLSRLSRVGVFLFDHSNERLFLYI